MISRLPRKNRAVVLVWSKRTEQYTSPLVHAGQSWLEVLQVMAPVVVKRRLGIDVGLQEEPQVPYSVHQHIDVARARRLDGTVAWWLPYRLGEPQSQGPSFGADSLDSDHGVFGGTVPTERGQLRPNRFPEPSAYRQHREVAEKARELASRVGLRQAAQQLGVSRDTLKNAWAHWNLPQPQRKPTNPPSRFLTDRGEAERAFRLAEQLGSINAAAAQLGTTWPSLRKAFQRHQLGTPQPNPAAVNQRKSIVQLARLGGQRPTAPELDPTFVQLNPGTVPQARGHTATSAVRLRRAEEIQTLGFGVVADMNHESRSQRPSVRHRAVQRRAERAQQLLAERASRPAKQQAERAQRPTRTHTERTERSGRPHHLDPYRDER